MPYMVRKSYDRGERNITMHKDELRSQLFMLRMWSEEIDGLLEWRGKIQNVVNGETLYFRDMDAILGFLRTNLETSAPKQKQEDSH
jgi:hypothetical protein